MLAPLLVRSALRRSGSGPRWARAPVASERAAGASAPDRLVAPNGVAVPEHSAVQGDWAPPVAWVRDVALLTAGVASVHRCSAPVAPVRGPGLRVAAAPVGCGVRLPRLPGPAAGKQALVAHELRSAEPVVPAEGAGAQAESGAQREGRRGVTVAERKVIGVGPLPPPDVPAARYFAEVAGVRHGCRRPFAPHPHRHGSRPLVPAVSRPARGVVARNGSAVALRRRPRDADDAACPR